ncbi:hypothetical protein NPIL_404541 [Nephila pilipes]|uniref:Uncharacterized protein n=1 Tax=Nephila pilipes TaxID=299642 RepID=A0A8X6R356_NEPPI|nr:hypothetical protein NPIL_404541 [Nephila pilipes]
MGRSSKDNMFRLDFMWDHKDVEVIEPDNGNTKDEHTFQGGGDLDKGQRRGKIGSNPGTARQMNLRGLPEGPPVKWTCILVWLYVHPDPSYVEGQPLDRWYLCQLD